jgi:hypothetical protein
VIDEDLNKKDASLNIREAEERNKFEKSSFVQKEIMKAFKEIKL